MLEHFKIYTKTFDFLLWIFPTVNKFPKSQRFVLGQQIENTVIEVLKGIIQANSERDKEKREPHLKEINTNLEILRSLLRLSYKLKFISHKQYEYAVKEADEVGRMLGGWMKAVSGGAEQ